MADSRAYWIWCQQAFGPGSSLPVRLHSSFPGGLAGLCQAGPRAWKGLPGIPPQARQALAGFSLAAAEERLGQALSLGWQVFTPACAGYPEPLRCIPTPPAVLYMLGRWPNFSQAPVVAVAGSRDPLSISRATARRMGYQLASSGVVVVSGNAVGVDFCVLDAALQAGGQVISVLPVDLGSSYPAATCSLRQRILDSGGALVSESFSQPVPEPGAFQKRNRLVTGLSRAVVLIQAGMHSGTMIYATCAGNQGREVQVCPGPDCPEYAGSRALLQDGATPVASGLDVLRSLPHYCRETGRATYLYPQGG